MYRLIQDIDDDPNSRDDAAENDPLGQGRVPSVGNHHVGLAALCVGADVHVHERLAPARPLCDLDQVLFVRVELQVALGVNHLLVNVELKTA